MCNCGVAPCAPPHSGGGGAQIRSLSVQKNEKITRTEPILKSNSTFFFFPMMGIKSFTDGEGLGVMLPVFTRGVGRLRVGGIMINSSRTQHT